MTNETEVKKDVTIGLSVMGINKLQKEGYKLIKENNRIYALKEIKEAGINNNREEVNIKESKLRAEDLI